jgi:uncharacterized protein (DUF2345 family)
MIEAAIKRIIYRLFPELTARYHLPRFGRVESVRETQSEGDICDEFRPFYAVDVQILTEHGKPDKKWPVLKDVPLSLPVAGQEMGQFAFPDAGTWVEIAFAYGSPNRPFIRCILPHDLSQPPVARGEQRWQHNPGSFQQADKDGNWQRKTDGQISDESIDRLTQALDSIERYHKSLKETNTDDTELIGAIKKIEAYGAMILQSGGRFDLGSLHDFNVNCQAVTNIVSAGNINTSSQANTSVGSTGNISTSSGAKTTINSADDFNTSSGGKTTIASDDNVTVASQKKISLSGTNATMSSDQFSMNTGLVDIDCQGNAFWNALGDMNFNCSGEMTISGTGFSAGADGVASETAGFSAGASGISSSAGGFSAGAVGIVSEIAGFSASEDGFSVSSPVVDFSSAGQIDLAGVGDISLTGQAQFKLSSQNATLNSELFNVSTAVIDLNSSGQVDMSSGVGFDFNLTGQRYINLDSQNVIMNPNHFGVNSLYTYIDTSNFKVNLSDFYVSTADINMVSSTDIDFVSSWSFTVTSQKKVNLISVQDINLNSQQDINIDSAGKINLNGEVSFGGDGWVLSTSVIDLSSLTSVDLSSKGSFIISAQAMSYVDANDITVFTPIVTQMTTQGETTISSQATYNTDINNVTTYTKAKTKLITEGETTIESNLLSYTYFVDEVELTKYVPVSTNINTDGHTTINSSAVSNLDVDGNRLMTGANTQITSRGHTKIQSLALNHTIDNIMSFTPSDIELFAQGSINLSGQALSWQDINNNRIINSANFSLAMGGDIDVLATSFYYTDSLGDPAVLHRTQRYRAAYSWIGSETENLFNLVSELMQVNMDLCTLLADHTHPANDTVSASQTDINSKEAAISDIKTRLDNITAAS